MMSYSEVSRLMFSSFHKFHNLACLIQFLLFPHFHSEQQRIKMMNKYCTLFSTLLCFVSIRRYEEIFCFGCRKVSTVTTTNETEIIGCCHPRNWVKYCNMYFAGLDRRHRGSLRARSFCFLIFCQTLHIMTQDRRQPA